MLRVHLLVIAIIAVVFAGCTQSNLPPGVLEFEVAAGKFQVTTPPEWVETPELGGYHAVESADLDFVFGVISVDPSDEQMSIYRNPREYEVNGRKIMVYDGPSGSRRPNLYFGIEYDPEEAFHAVVTIGQRRYHVMMVRSSTIEPREEHEQIVIGLAASLAPMP